MVPIYMNSTQKTSVNWIIRVMSSLFCWPKVILLSGGHCILKWVHKISPCCVRLKTKGVRWVIRKIASTSGWMSANDWRTPNVVVSPTLVLFPSVTFQLSPLRMSPSGSPLGQDVFVGDPRSGYGLKDIEDPLLWNSGSATSTRSGIKCKEFLIWLLFI